MCDINITLYVLNLMCDNQVCDIINNITHQILFMMETLLNISTCKSITVALIKRNVYARNAYHKTIKFKYI